MTKMTKSNDNPDNWAKRLRDAQAVVDGILSELKSQLLDAIHGQPFDGTMLSGIGDGKPIAFLLPASALGKCWSPEYHAPVLQAEAIGKRLNSCKTAQSVKSAVAGILESRRVGPYDAPVYLNPTTMQTLRESTLGRLALEDPE